MCCVSEREIQKWLVNIGAKYPMQPLAFLQHFLSNIFGIQDRWLVTSTIQTFQSPS
jgi:hypothetical protein